MQGAWGSYSQQQQQGGVMGLGCVGASLPQQLLPYGDAMAYAAALRLLQDQAEYSPGALERTVEAIRADVSAVLRCCVLCVGGGQGLQTVGSCWHGLE
jgi:hypothetical protein